MPASTLAHASAHRNTLAVEQEHANTPQVYKARSHKRMCTKAWARESGTGHQTARRSSLQLARGVCQPLRRICAKAMVGRGGARRRLVKIKPHHGRLRLAIKFAASHPRRRQEADTHHTRLSNMFCGSIAQCRSKVDVNARVLANGRGDEHRRASERTNAHTHPAM